MEAEQIIAVDLRKELVEAQGADGILVKFFKHEPDEHLACWLTYLIMEMLILLKFTEGFCFLMQYENLFAGCF